MVATVPEGVVIRAYMLQKEDVFKQLGTKFRVIEITDREIRCAYYCNRNRRVDYIIGRNSQQRVELIIEL